MQIKCPVKLHEYSIKYYKFYYNINKIINITTFGYKNNNNSKELINTFINTNKNIGLWIIGRDGEHYFTCPSYNDVLQILKEKNLKFECVKTNDLYLIHIN